MRTLRTATKCHHHINYYSKVYLEAFLESLKRDFKNKWANAEMVNVNDRKENHKIKWLGRKQRRIVEEKGGQLYIQYIISTQGKVILHA
jgi:hypothetical protein